MDKKILQIDIGLIAGMCCRMGDHMKIEEPNRVVTDEEMHMTDMYGELAFALRNLDDAINALPD